MLTKICIAPRRVVAIRFRPENGISAGTITLTQVPVTCCGATTATNKSLPSELNAILAVFVDRVVPASAGNTGGVVDYILGSLTTLNQNEVTQLTRGLALLDDAAKARYQTAFARLETAHQDALLLSMETGELRALRDAPQIFNRLHRLSLEGMFQVRSVSPI